MMGPVQVLVIGFDEPTIPAEFLNELVHVGEDGPVRLVDLLLVKRKPDSTLETLGTPAGLSANLGGIAARLLTHSEGAQAHENAANDGSAGWSLAEAVAPGTAAAVVLLEHVWAIPLKAAIRRAGGAPIEETWLAPDDLAALESLMTDAGR